MNIILVGLNHRTAPVEIREKLALDSCEPAVAYQEIKAGGALLETLYISTCNRVEIVGVTASTDSAREEIVAFMSSRRQVPPRDFQDHLYLLRDRDAVRHLFRVASSLDSMILGEPQILGQLKDSYRSAVLNHSAGPILNRLFHKSFSVAKRVRTETGIASHAVSISYAAVELARKIFGDLAGKKILLIGAGEMAELAAQHLLTQGASEIVSANRTLERAVLLSRRWNGRAASLDEIPALLAEVDIVISSTGAPDLVVRAKTVRSVLRARKHRPLFFVDIAVPRDIDPEVNRLDNVYLFDIDDLKGVVEENRASRSEEAVRAERIVDEETLSFLSWMETLDTVPTIVALKQKAESIAWSELKKTLGKIGPLSAEQAGALETMALSMAHKMIHDPILFLKAAGRHGKKDFYLDLARRFFGLDREAEAKSETLEAEDAGDSNKT
ncbi:MAG: glutamyl-tRNA reductase [Pseudomonadota bacterium]